MSKFSLNSLSIALPDDRPITAVQIVENTDRCPSGFFPISRTYDQDQDADLWREGSFLKRKIGRYLCLSKTEGFVGSVIEEVVVIGEKSAPPIGYSLLNRTVDSHQKAWRKKQLCYRLVPRTNATLAVTDIIVCSRLKKAPEGFSLAGEINGVILCYKMGNVQDSGVQNGKSARPAPPPPTVYPNLANGGDDDYEILSPGPPARPTQPIPPHRPAPATPTNNTHTLAAHHLGLDGVPFVINPRFMPASNGEKSQLPVIKARTMQQLMKDYEYNFTIERQ